MGYIFNIGDRVAKGGLRFGEVTMCVPGDGKDPWYYVTWEDGTEDRYQAHELTAA